MNRDRQRRRMHAARKRRVWLRAQYRAEQRYERHKAAYRAHKALRYAHGYGMAWGGRSAGRSWFMEELRRQGKSPTMRPLVTSFDYERVPITIHRSQGKSWPPSVFIGVDFGKIEERAVAFYLDEFKDIPVELFGLLRTTEN